MSQEIMHRLYRPKLGPAWDGGAQTVNTAVGKNTTQLEPGWWSIEASIDTMVVQCDLTRYTTPGTAANLRSVLGKKIPANTEVHFFVADDKTDGYLIWTCLDGASSGTLRIHRNNSIQVG